MKIVPTLFLTFLIILGLLGSAIISMRFVTNSRQQSTQATLLLYQNHKRATQLRQRSDDLTKMARAYVVTKDPAYEKKYYDILALHNANRHHPVNNDKRHHPANNVPPYQDFISAQEKDIPRADVASSLPDILNQGSSLTQEERTIFENALQASDNLTAVEERAFGALHGLFPDKTGQLSIQGNPNSTLAQEMLYNAAYHKSKEAIMQPISQFIRLTNKRLVNEINSGKVREDRYILITTFLVFAALLFVIIAFFYLKKRLVSPIITLSNIAQHTLDGALDDRAMMTSNDEIEYLSNTFNSVIKTRAQNEAELKSNEINLRIILNSIGEAVITTDTAGNITRMNPVAEKLSEWNFKEAEGQPLFDVFHIINGQTRASVSNPVQKLLKNGGRMFMNNNVILISKYGKQYNIADSMAPLYSDTGDTVGMVLVLRDITSDYVAHNALHESEGRFKRLFENSEIAICNEDFSELIIALEDLRRKGISDIRQYCETDPQIVWDLINKIKLLQINTAAVKLFGMPPNQRLKDPFSEAFFPKALELFISGLCAVWDRKHIFRSVVQFKDHDGKILDAIISFPIPATLGEFKSIPVSIIDITEHKKLEQHLLRSQKMEAIGELAGGIAHDFNNLLGIIIGNLDLIDRKMTPETKLHNYLKKAQNAALRGSSLIRRLLNLSHQSPEISRPTNINTIIKGMEYLVDSSLSHNITIDTILANDLWTVDINIGGLEDMLINLLLNARDAMPDGGRLTIKTQNIPLDHPTITQNSTLAPGEYVEISVNDTGIGMSQTITSNIFEPFFTTKSKNKGTGLGLAMVYSFVQRSKGNISVQSKKGVGTTFLIYLPRSKPATNSIQKPIASPTPQSMPRGTETILVVDDEKGLSLIAKNILDPLGHKVICAYDCYDAIAILKKIKTIDLLFFDVVMASPLSGFDLAEQALALRPNLKILLTSDVIAMTQDDIRLKKWDKLMITKPYRNIDLSKNIRTTLDRKD